jgi:hypothetical protein
MKLSLGSQTYAFLLDTRWHHADLYIINSSEFSLRLIIHIALSLRWSINAFNIQVKTICLVVLKILIMCPPQTLQSNGPNNTFFSPTSLDSNVSTKNSWVEIVTTANWLKVMMDVTIVNNEATADNEYLRKFQNAETLKITIRLNMILYKSSTVHNNS